MLKLMARATLYQIFSLLFSGILTGHAASMSDTGQTLSRSITVLYSARTHIINEYETKQLDESSRWEKDEFLVFLSYIDGRILYYCKQLYQNQGPEGLAGLPCPSVAAQPTEKISNMLPGTDAVTNPEQTAEVETEFQASLGQFDEMLLKEQEQIEKHAPKQREYPAAGATSGSRQSYPDDQATRQEPGNGSQGGSGDQAQPGEMSRAETRGGGAGSTKQTRTLPTTGNKEFSEGGDDIVARQLREAAERETDPEIKARLWEEYYKYKQGIQ